MEPPPKKLRAQKAILGRETPPIKMDKKKVRSRGSPTIPVTEQPVPRRAPFDAPHRVVRYRRISRRITSPLISTHFQADRLDLDIGGNVNAERRVYGKDVVEHLVEIFLC